MIVIGAGHAGIEAAHAAATLGAKTAVFTMSLDAIGNMPCNPSIGGTAKGTLVRELDALGGVMGLAADATYLQSRMLNKGKGPAVHALRVQTDRKRYHEYMKHALELTPGLAIHQAEVVGIEVENGHVKGIVTQLNGEYSATFLYSDFKKHNGYERSIELSARCNLYRQDYCGCIYSKAEREKQKADKEKQESDL